MHHLLAFLDQTLYWLSSLLCHLDLHSQLHIYTTPSNTSAVLLLNKFIFKMNIITVIAQKDNNNNNNNNNNNDSQLKVIVAIRFL